MTHIPEFGVSAPLTWSSDPNAPQQVEYYEGVQEATGITMTSWFDYMGMGPLENYAGYIDGMHRRSIYVMGTQSMILTYKPRDKPPKLLETVIRDPCGNMFTSNFGLSGTIGVEDEWNMHSMLHPAWQDYLLGDIKTGHRRRCGRLPHIDELCHGTILNPDFNENTLELFEDYLVETLSPAELSSTLGELSYGSIEEFDIALPDTLLGESLTATYNSPGEAGQEVEITLEGDVLHASLPEIDVWGVLLITVSGAS